MTEKWQYRVSWNELVGPPEFGPWVDAKPIKLHGYNIVELRKVPTCPSCGHELESEDG